MKIAKARLVDPERNFWFGVAATSLSVFVFAYSARFGQVSVLLYYALWLPLVLVDYRRALGNYAKFHWVLAFGLFAGLSVFWSAAPSITARASIQYMTHIVCALIAARTINIRTLTLGGLAGTTLVLIYSMLFGRYHHDPLDGSYSFVGAFTSKNQLGFYASLGFYFAFAAILVLRERGVWLVAALFGGAVSVYSLIASQSATSIIATALTLVATLGLGGTFVFSPRARKLLILAGCILAGFGAVAALNLGAFDLVLGAFGKDATLTGRTYLWSEGMAAGREVAIAGVGYQAYWVHGFAGAERLWEEFYIDSRMGFHFHNTYIAMFVELGAVGVLLFALVLVSAVVGHLARLLADDGDRSSYIIFGLMLMLLVRSFFELDMVNPYAIGSFLLYYAAGRLAARRPRRRPAFPAGERRLRSGGVLEMQPR